MNQRGEPVFSKYLGREGVEASNQRDRSVWPKIDTKVPVLHYDQIVVD